MRRSWFPTHPALRAGLLLVLAALAWDAGGLDLAVMRWWGDARGFGLREHPWLARYGHDVAQDVLRMALVAWLALLAWGGGPVRAWRGRERLAVALGVLASLVVVGLVKRASLTSCPWDLAEFGGMARYVSHWRLGVADGGGAHCFPGGHASAALAFVGAALPGLGARRAGRGGGLLLALLLAGTALGAVQTLRGAHYPSHTLWTMVICYATSGAVWWAVHAGAARKQAGAYQPSPR